MRDDAIELTGRPGASLTIPVVLQAASLAGTARPGSSLLDWINANRSVPIGWDPVHTPRLVDIASGGKSRALRFLEVSGVLERALPEVADFLERRRHDSSELDPSRILRFPTAERLAALLAEGDLAATRAAQATDRIDLVRLAAMVHDVGGLDHGTRAALASRLVSDQADAAMITQLLDEAALLASAAGDPDSFDRQRIQHLAHHLGSPERAHQAHLLALAEGEVADWRRDAAAELVRKVTDVLESESRGLADGALLERHKRYAKDLAVSEAVRDRIDAANDAYVLSHDPDELARHARLVEPLPARGTVRVAVTPLGELHHWQVDVAFRDDRQALARLTASLTDHGLDIVRADVTTWPDGGAIHSYIVHGSLRPSARELAEEFERRGRTPLTTVSLVDARIEFDNTALPWHSSCTLTCADEPGVLQTFAEILANCGVLIADARITSADGVVTDRFSLTDRRGQKLDDATMARIDGAVHQTGRRKRRLAPA